jgi:hypothetical protein
MDPNSNGQERRAEKGGTTPHFFATAGELAVLYLMSCQRQRRTHAANGKGNPAAGDAEVPQPGRSSKGG